MAWTAAVDADGRARNGAAVAELAGMLPAGMLTPIEYEKLTTTATA
jgi:hypothetical protein